MKRQTAILLLNSRYQGCQLLEFEKLKEIGIEVLHQLSDVEVKEFGLISDNTFHSYFKCQLPDSYKCINYENSKGVYKCSIINEKRIEILRCERHPFVSSMSKTTIIENGAFINAVTD